MEAQLSFERELELEPKKKLKKNQKRTRKSAIPETCGFEHGVYKGKGSFQGFLFHQPFLETKTNRV
jgi:hypothetical protein